MANERMIGTIPTNFVRLLEEAAVRFGTSKAVTVLEDGGELSFVELHHRTIALAAALARRGVGQGSHVGVLLPNRLEYPVVWLALAVLGAVMVPTHVKAAARELEYLYGDADIGALIIDEDLLPAYTQMIVRPPRLSESRVFVCGSGHTYRATTGYADIRQLMSEPAGEFVPARNLPASTLLNIQYTSGTTGAPKGCMQEQDYWLVLAATVADYVGDIRSLLADHPFFYMDPQWMLVFCLMKGARLFIAPRMSARSFIAWAREYQFEMAYFPKPLLNMPAEESERHTNLKMLLASELSAQQIRLMQARFGVPVRQVYGMTEIGAGLMVPLDSDDDEMLTSCGLPAPLREYRIVDADGNDVPDAQSGELLVRGRGIFKGYYNRPEANRSSFRGDWFRTGDLFVRGGDGSYRIIGRIKDMIRRSGENISAAEVEQVLRELPAVADAAVIPVPDAHRGQEVKAVLVLKDGYAHDALSGAEIFDHCRRRLAAFKCPRYVQFSAELPRTASGKIAKAELAAQVTSPPLDLLDLPAG